jgi:hypothetical protein
MDRRTAKKLTMRFVAVALFMECCYGDHFRGGWGCEIGVLLTSTCKNTETYRELKWWTGYRVRVHWLFIVIILKKFRVS